MVHIRVTRGLSIPIAGDVQENSVQEVLPQKISIDTRPWIGIFCRLLVQEGETVARNTPLLHMKDHPESCCVAPFDSRVVHIRRGEKRRLLEVVLERSEEQIASRDILVPTLSMEPEQIGAALSRSGLLFRFYGRPFHMPVIHLKGKKPRSCFVRALNTKPLSPSMEQSLLGQEEFFTQGLRLVERFLSCPIHVVARPQSPLLQRVPKDLSRIQCHTIEGPHPACSSSVHIHYIDPISSPQDCVWAIDAIDVARIGYFMETGRLDMKSIISRAGDGFLPEARNYIRTLEGASVQELIEGAIDSMAEGPPSRIISGDPLTGDQVTSDDFLRVGHTSIAAIPEYDESKRELLHFFRLGSDKFSASKAYLSGHMNRDRRTWHFTTNMHGEERAFIDGSVYERVMPMNVLPMQLVKAILAEDIDKAIDYGLLEVTADDFALAEFVCPSKIPMMHIVRKGIEHCVAEMMS